MEMCKKKINDGIQKFLGKWVSKLAGDFQTKYRDKQFEKKKHTENNAKI